MKKKSHRLPAGILPTQIRSVAPTASCTPKCRWFVLNHPALSLQFFIFIIFNFFFVLWEKDSLPGETWNTVFAIYAPQFLTKH